MTAPMPVSVMPVVSTPVALQAHPGLPPVPPLPSFPLRNRVGDLGNMYVAWGIRNKSFDLMLDELISKNAWRYVWIENGAALAGVRSELGVPDLPLLSYPSEMVVGCDRSSLVFASPIPAAMPFDEWAHVISVAERARAVAAYPPMALMAAIIAYLSAFRYPDVFERAYRAYYIPDKGHFFREQTRRVVSLFERNHSLDIYPY